MSDHQPERLVMGSIIDRDGDNSRLGVPARAHPTNHTFFSNAMMTNDEPARRHYGQGISQALYQRTSCIPRSRSSMSVLCTLICQRRSLGQRPCRIRGLLLWFPYDFFLSSDLIITLNIHLQEGQNYSKFHKQFRLLRW